MKKRIIAAIVLLLFNGFTYSMEGFNRDIENPTYIVYSASNSGSNTLNIWDVSFGKMLQTVSTREHIITQIAFNPHNRNMLAVVLGDNVAVLGMNDLMIGKYEPDIVHSPQAGTTIKNIFFSSDGDFLIVFQSSYIRDREVERNIVFKVKGCDFYNLDKERFNFSSNVSFGANGLLIAGICSSVGPKVIYCNQKSFDIDLPLEENEKDNILDFAFSSYRDNILMILVSADSETRLKLFDINKREIVKCFNFVSNKEGWDTVLLQDNTQGVLCLLNELKIDVYDINENTKREFTLESGESSLITAIFDPENPDFIAMQFALPDKIQVINVNTGNVVLTIEVPDTLNCFAYQPAAESNQERLAREDEQERLGFLSSSFVRPLRVERAAIMLEQEEEGESDDIVVPRGLLFGQ